jgi:hypothetical protein
VSPSFRGCERRHITGAGDESSPEKQTALSALSVIASVAAPASAADQFNTQGGRDVGQSSPL